MIKIEGVDIDITTIIDPISRSWGSSLSIKQILGLTLKSLLLSVSPNIVQMILFQGQLSIICHLFDSRMDY